MLNADGDGDGSPVATTGYRVVLREDQGTERCGTRAHTNKKKKRKTNREEGLRQGDEHSPSRMEGAALARRKAEMAHT